MALCNRQSCMPEMTTSYYYNYYCTTKLLPLPLCVMTLMVLHRQTFIRLQPSLSDLSLSSITYFLGSLGSHSVTCEESTVLKSYRHLCTGYHCCQQHQGSGRVGSDGYILREEFRRNLQNSDFVLELCFLLRRKPQFVDDFDCYVAAVTPSKTCMQHTYDIASHCNKNTYLWQIS